METKSNSKILSRDEIDDFLIKNRAGVLSITDGKAPYAIPMGYSYADNCIYLTPAGKGRKMEYIEGNNNACFTVFWISEGFGQPGKTDWGSVIVEGPLEHITDPDELTKVVRISEKQIGLPEGAMEKLLQMTLKNPEGSFFWKLSITRAGGRNVVDEKLEIVD